MNLPNLPGRLNEPLAKALVYLLGVPLVVCLGFGLVTTALGSPSPSVPVPTSTSRAATVPTSQTTAPTTPAPVIPTATTPPTTTAVAPTKAAVPPPPPPPPVEETTPQEPSGNDPRFATCAEAKRHGYGPYYRGIDPEYNWYIDRDSDGKVCE